MWLSQSTIRADTYVSRHSLEGVMPEKVPDLYDQFTLLSYNIDCDSCGCSSYSSDRVLKIISAIVKTNADIVCLQETHRYWEETMEHLIGSDIYPYRFWHDPPPDAFPGGIGILSKFPITKNKLLKNLHKIPGSWFPMWSGRVELPTNQQVKLCIVHLRPPLYNLGYQWGVLSPINTNQFRLDEVKYLARHLARSKNNHLPVIIAGDFNENDSGGSLEYLTNDGTGRGIEVSRASDWMNRITGTEDTDLEKRLGQLKFIDCVKKFVPNDVETHRFPIPLKIAHGMVLRSRLDHVLYTVDRLTCHGCVVAPGYETGASDHMPVFTHFSLREAEQPPDNDSESSSEGDPEGNRYHRMVLALKGMGFTKEEIRQHGGEGRSMEDAINLILTERANKTD